MTYNEPYLDKTGAFGPTLYLANHPLQKGRLGIYSKNIAVGSGYSIPEALVGAVLISLGIWVGLMVEV